jgi:hypothetical protein
MIRWAETAPICGLVGVGEIRLPRTKDGRQVMG